VSLPLGLDVFEIGLVHNIDVSNYSVNDSKRPRTEPPTSRSKSEESSKATTDVRRSRTKQDAQPVSRTAKRRRLIVVQESSEEEVGVPDQYRRWSPPPSCPADAEGTTSPLRDIPSPSGLRTGRSDTVDVESAPDPRGPLPGGSSQRRRFSASTRRGVR